MNEISKRKWKVLTLPCLFCSVVHEANAFLGISSLGFDKMKSSNNKIYDLHLLKLKSSSRILREYDLETDFGNDWPFNDEVDFQRLDEEEDSEFYSKPRMVQHIDEWAVLSLRSYYDEELSSLPSDIKILDLCSSWTCNYPNGNLNDEGTMEKRRTVIGVGMNEEELSSNEQLDSYYVQDLNLNPLLSSLEDGSFDVVTMALSVDYLTRPKEVFQEIHRVLKPGGTALIPISNRYFRTKAIQKWLETKDDQKRLDIVANYIHYSEKWKSIQARDIKLETSFENIQQFVGNQNLFKWFATAIFRGTWATDPLYVVKAMKK